MICDWYIITTQTYYVFKSISIESRSRKTYQMTQRSPKSGKGLQKEIHLGESMQLVANFGRHLDFVCHKDTHTSKTRLYQSINVILCHFHFHENFHCWVTPKCFIIEISPWYTLFIVPNVFPLNSGHRKTYEKTQISQTSVNGLRKEVYHCESLKLVAILDAILDF